MYVYIFTGVKEEKSNTKCMAQHVHKVHTNDI